jgi:hypothetical protein
MICFQPFSINNTSFHLFFSLHTHKHVSNAYDLIFLSSEGLMKSFIIPNK